MRRRVALVLTVLLLHANAFAIGVDQNPLADPAQEARAQELFLIYRCVVCDNQSIADSEAGVAEDLRALVREQISDGRSDEEISAYLVARYGDFVLLEPPVRLRTLALWGLPFLLLIAGAGAVLLRKRSVKANVSEGPSDSDRARLEAWRDREK